MNEVQEPNPNSIYSAFSITVRGLHIYRLSRRDESLVFKEMKRLIGFIPDLSSGLFLDPKESNLEVYRDKKYLQHDNDDTISPGNEGKIGRLK